MSEDEMWAATPRYLSARQKAATSAVQITWEQARSLSYYTLLASPKKFKIKKPQDVYKFSWEQEVPRFVKQSKEQLQAFSDEADEILRQTQPEVYAKYMAAKNAQQNAGSE